MVPAPTAIAASTPRSRPALTPRATGCTRSGAVPYCSSPIRASPDSLSRIRLKAGAMVAEPIDDGPAREPRRRLLADGEAREAADHDVLARRGGELVAQLLHGLAV